MGQVSLPAGYMISDEERKEWSNKWAPLGPEPAIVTNRYPGSSSVTLSGYINPEFEKFHGRKPTDEEVALAVAGLLHFGASGYVGNDGKFNIKKYTD